MEPTNKFLAKKTEVFLNFITNLLSKVVQEREGSLKR